MSKFKHEAITHYLTEEELLQVIEKDNKLKQVNAYIKMIDIDNNGYVTNGELNNCFKGIYKDQITGGKSLTRIFKPFSSM